MVELLAQTDSDLLAELLGTSDDLAALLGREVVPAGGLLPDADPDAIPVEVETRCQAGDLWGLGEHRLVVGEAGDAEIAARLMGGEKPDVLLTDPPYCSGGFQEAGRSIGGASAIDKNKQDRRRVLNDTLSTRGYQALLRSVLGRYDAGLVYVFTDWRMWIPCFDVVESLGFGVRSMIVWDKMSMALGVGWRAQHELIMCGFKSSKPFENTRARGNVIAVRRTGNECHPTQKPVELLTEILAVTAGLPGRVVDPFAGSGSTLIAAEQVGWICHAAELLVQHADTCLARWEAATGREAVRLEAGA
jgi:DNA modification methylase